jgi:hypothetical protein
VLTYNLDGAITKDLRRPRLEPPENNFLQLGDTPAPCG